MYGHIFINMVKSIKTFFCAKKMVGGMFRSWDGDTISFFSLHLSLLFSLLK